MESFIAQTKYQRNHIAIPGSGQNVLQPYTTIITDPISSTYKFVVGLGRASDLDKISSRKRKEHQYTVSSSKGLVSLSFVKSRMSNRGKASVPTIIDVSEII